MISSRIKLSLGAIVMVGLIIPILLQRQQLAQLRAENAALRQQAAELAVLPATNQRPVSQPPDAELSARFQREHQELVRLRGEVARLRLGLAQSGLREHSVQGNTTPEQPGAGDPPLSVRCTATATATVHAGDSFATGGWVTSPGTRTFFLATPSLVPGDAGERIIDISTILMKMPEADLPDPLLKKLQAHPAGFAGVDWQ